MKKLATLSILLAGCLWGMMGIFVRCLNSYGLDSLKIVAARCLTACLLLGIFLLVYDRKLFRIKLKDLWCFAGTGLCSIVFFNYCYFRTITKTSLSAAAVLLYTAPVIVMVLSLFLFQEKLSLQKLAALLLVFGGCICVSGAGWGSEKMETQALLVGLGAGLGYALYSIFGRYAVERGYHPMTITFYTFLIAAAGIAPLTSYLELGRQMVREPSAFLWVLGHGFFITVLPYLLYTFGLVWIESSRAAVMASIEPAAATVTGILLFHEKPTAAGGAGMLLVLAGILVLNLKERKIKKI